MSSTNACGSARIRISLPIHHQAFITKLSSPSFHHQAFITKLSSPSFHHQAFIAKLSSPSFHRQAFIAMLFARNALPPGSI
jgi:hypothetical protein